MQYMPNSADVWLPTPASAVNVGLPLVAQVFAVPLVPGLKPAPATLALSSSLMAPTSSSSARVVVGVAPLDGDPPVPVAAAVWSSGVLVSPVTANARARWLKG